LFEPSFSPRRCKGPEFKPAPREFELVEFSIELLLFNLYKAII
jgi:hypothetical protein